MADLLPIICGFRARARRPRAAWRRALPGAPLRHRPHVHRARARRRRPPVRRPVPDRRSFRGDGQHGLSLALRSSTRAVPLLALGLALGSAALVDAIGRTIAWRRAVFAAAVVLVALGNLPVLTGHRLVDPALERDEDPPAAWTEAAAALDDAARRATACCSCRAPSSGRSAGATPSIRRCPADRPPARHPRPPPARLAGGDGPPVRPRRPLPGRSGRARRRRPDRPPVRRRHDLAARRRRLRPLPHAPPGARPPTCSPRGSDGLGEPVAYGDPAVNVPTCRWSTSSRCPSRQSARRSPRSSWSPSTTRCRSCGPATVVVLSGSGDGLVDAAAAGLIDGDEAIRYTASMSGDELADAVADRRRRHRHRLQPATRPPLAQLAGRHRLHRAGIGRPDRVGGLRRRPARRVPRRRHAAYTVSCRTGRCRCGRAATGSRSATGPRPGRAGHRRRPEHGVDGARSASASTSRSRPTTGVDHVTLLQPAGLGDVRRLRHGTVTVDGGAPQEVGLDDRSLVTGQRIDFPATSGPTTIRVTLGRIVGAREATLDPSGSPSSTPGSARAPSGSSCPAT